MPAVLAALLFVELAPAAVWLKDLDQAKATAAKAKQPILVVFRCEH